MTATNVRGDSKKTQTSAFVGSAILASGKLLAVVFTLGIHVLLVRSLSKDDFGAFGYASSAVNLIAILTSLGMEQTISRFASQYDEQQDAAKLSGLVVFYTTTVLLLGTVSTVVLVAFPQQVERLANIDATTAATLAALCALGPLQAFDTMLMNIFATFAQPKTVFWRRYVVAPGIRLAVVLGVLCTTGNVVHIALGYVLGVAIGVLIYAPIAFGVMRANGMFAKGLSLRFAIRTWLTFTAGSLASDLLIVMLFFSDVFMVGWLGTADDVAALHAVTPVANGGLVIFYALIPIFLPSVTRLFHQGARSEAAQTFSRSTAWIICFTLPVTTMTVGFAAATNNLLFSSDYASSANILAAAAAAQFFVASFGLTGLLLKAESKVWSLAAANAVIAVVNVALNVVLISHLGPLGAALGTLAAVVLLSAVKIILVQRLLTLPVLTRDVLLALGVAATVVGASALVQWFWQPPFVVCLGVGAVLCLTALRLARPILQLAEVFPGLARVPVVRYFA